MNLLLVLAIVACTGSMEPLFTCNQSIYLDPEFELVHGGVYVYQSENDRLIMHRLMYSNRFCATFKGDASLYNDKCVLLENIKYRVVE